MTFKTAMEHYRAGTASPEERRMVEAELDKFRQISEYLDSSWQEPAPPREPSRRELKRLRRNLRRRNAVLALTSLVLAAALLFGVFRYAIPCLETSLYWDPNTVSYGTRLDTDLGLTLYAYGELFCPNMCVESVTATHTGFASYSILAESFSFPRGERRYGYASLEKGKLTFQEGFWEELSQVCVGNKRLKTNEWDVELLSQLPEYYQVGAFVTFREDLTMAQALDFQESLSQELELSSINSFPACHWFAIRHQEQAFAHPCGISTGSISGRFPEMNGFYPCFDVDEAFRALEEATGSRPDQASVYEEHFKSVLRFLDDRHQAGRGIQVPDSPNYYSDALAYVEEHGVNVYGCYITASPQFFLRLIQQENIQYISLYDAWLTLYS